MRAIERSRAHADPRVMRAQVQPALLARHLAGQRLLVGQQQCFMRGVEVDAVEVVHAGPAARGGGHAAFVNQHVQCQQQVQVRQGHDSLQ